MKGKFFSILVMVAFLTNTVKGQNIFLGYEHLFTTPRQYTAYQTTDNIKIDGKLKEASWSNVAWSDYFTDIEGKISAEPSFKTRFKILWDSQYVYIAAELEEPHIWATLKQHDDIIFHDNDFEIFINPSGDTHNYFEIEVNADNTIFDLFLPKPYRSGGIPLLNWDAQHLRTAVQINGTINNAKDIDKSWFVEMAIPFKSISVGNKLLVPKDNMAWRINFSRVQWDTKIINGVYVKDKDSTTQQFKPEHNLVWSPQGVINMHLPERWGYLNFSTQKVDTSTASYLLPLAEELKKYLWLLFYKQQTYRLQHNLYATYLSQINFPLFIDFAGVHYSITLQATANQYEAVLQDISGKEKWQINQDGKIIKL